jgi:hypothetical protein
VAAARTPTPNQRVVGQSSDAIVPCSIPLKWKSLDEVLDFWNGTGAYEGKPMPGGIKAMEITHKARWRKSFTPAQCKNFSRIKIVCTSLEQILSDPDFDLTPLSQTFLTECKTSVSAFQKRLERDGIYQANPRPKKRSRPNRENAELPAMQLRDDAFIPPQIPQLLEQV